MEDSAFVHVLVAVVRRREEGDDALVVAEWEFVAVHDGLVGAANQVELESVEEALEWSETENVACAAVVFIPLFDFWVRVGPEHVAKKAFFGDLDGALNRANVVQVEEGWGDSAVDAEDLVFDNSGHREVLENIAELVPEVLVEARLALLEEAENAVDIGTLVVSAQQEKVLWVSNLECKEKANGFNALAAAVHVVAEKQVIRVRWVLALFENAEQVVELPVCVTADGQGRLQLKENGLLREDLADVCAKQVNLPSGDWSRRAWALCANGKELLDDRVDLLIQLRHM